MREKILSALLVLCLFHFSASAQTFANGISYPYVNQFYNNQLLYNPGFAGEWDQPHFGFVTYSDSSSNYNNRQALDFHYNRPLEKYRLNFGLLFSYYKQQRNISYQGQPFNIQKAQFKVGLAQNWEFEFGESSILKVGATLSLLHFEDNEQPPTSSAGNQVWIQTNERYFKPNVDIGFLLNSGIFFVGAGLHHVNQPSFVFWQDRVNGGTISDPFRQELFVTSGVKMKFDQIKVEPSIMLHQESREFFMDVATLFKYEDIAFIGINWKTSSQINTVQVDSLISQDRTTHPWGLTAGGRVLDKIQASVSYLVGEKRSTTSDLRYEPFLEINLAYFIRPNAIVSENE